MALPFFFVADVSGEGGIVVLDEETSKHITQVLRMKTGDELMLTNGKGIKAHAVITNDHRKRCEVKIQSSEREKERMLKVAIGISLLKNVSRFEWFLEKAAEIGVSEIIPLVCERTEKEKFRHDRMQQILVSAMLQSQQCRLPHLHQPAAFNQILSSENYPGKFIAHCVPEQKHSLAQTARTITQNSILLIGPEGDFTAAEIEAALQKGFQPVSLGSTRLRTETAGIVGAVLLCQERDYGKPAGSV